MAIRIGTSYRFKLWVRRRGYCLSGVCEATDITGGPLKTRRTPSHHPAMSNIKAVSVTPRAFSFGGCTPIHIKPNTPRTDTADKVRKMISGILKGPIFVHVLPQTKKPAAAGIT